MNRILNQEILVAQKAGLRVAYCVGEKAEEQSRWKETLQEQLEIGLAGAERDSITIAYEPLWAIGPARRRPDAAYMQKVAGISKRSQAVWMWYTEAD